VWIDIEDHADALEDGDEDIPDIENFPTLLLLRDGEPVFHGTVLPHAQVAERLLQQADALRRWPNRPSRPWPAPSPVWRGRGPEPGLKPGPGAYAPAGLLARKKSFPGPGPRPWTDPRRRSHACPTTTHPATLALTLDPTTWSTPGCRQHPDLLLTLGRQLRVAGYRLDPAARPRC
jgi:hypothetical protein